LNRPSMRAYIRSFFKSFQVRSILFFQRNIKKIYEFHFLGKNFLHCKSFQMILQFEIQKM
jgi:hypothetical protein